MTTRKGVPLVACAGIGAAGGLAAGLLGIGGGLIVVPLLVAFVGVPLKRAVGTSLVVVLVTSVLGVLTELVVAPDNLRWGAAIPLALGALAGAIAGARLVARTRARTLAMLLASLLLVAALEMIGLFDIARAAPRMGEEPAELVLLSGHLLAGLAAGILSAMFGIGGGILAVPALAMLHPGWSFQACRATSLIMIIPTAVLAGTLHRKLDNVDGLIARSLAPSAAIGAVAGVLLANVVPGRPLEWIFAVLLVASAVKMLRGLPRATSAQ